MNKVFLCIFASIAFSLYLLSAFGWMVCGKYLSVYTIEMLLSFDNLMMFYLIFKFFKIDADQQRSFLNIGIWSAFILRFMMICFGAVLLSKFHWLMYGFGIFLIYSASHMFIGDDNDDEAPEKVIKFFSKYLSPKWVVIGVIEFTDVMFALDSIPASFGITWNPLIIFSANVFALCGLRALYFVMLKMVDKFSYLEKGIAIILALVGVKMLWNF